MRRISGRPYNTDRQSERQGQVGLDQIGSDPETRHRETTRDGAEDETQDTQQPTSMKRHTASYSHHWRLQLVTKLTVGIVATASEANFRAWEECWSGIDQGSSPSWQNFFLGRNGLFLARSLPDSALQASI